MKRKFLKRKPNVRPMETKTLLPLAAAPIFDPTLVFDSWNRLAEISDDIELTNVSQSIIYCIIFPIFDRHKSLFSLRQAILKRNVYLSPTSQEQAAISSLVWKVQRILDGLIVTRGDFKAFVYECNSLFNKQNFNNEIENL